MTNIEFRLCINIYIPKKFKLIIRTYYLDKIVGNDKHYADNTEEIIYCNSPSQVWYALDKRTLCTTYIVYNTIDGSIVEEFGIGK